MFKQFLQTGAVELLQIDYARVAGINENIANLLLAAKFDVPVCPHASGVGLCDAAMLDSIAASGSLDGRMIEAVDHPNEQFVTPVAWSAAGMRRRVRPGRAPRCAGPQSSSMGGAADAPPLGIIFAEVPNDDAFAEA